jgi:hypothetical protein
MPRNPGQIPHDLPSARRFLLLSEACVVIETVFLAAQSSFRRQP